MLSIKNLSLLSVLLCLSITLHAQSTDEFELDQVYSIDPEGTISLNSDDAEVTVVGSDRSDVHVEVHYKLEVTGFSFGSRTQFEMNVREVNGNLVLEEKERDFSGITFGSSDEEYTIRIETPHHVSLDFQGDDEYYEVRELNGRISINADDADAELTGCRGDQFEFNLDDGNIEMDEGRGSLQIDVDDGQAEIQNGNFETIRLSSDDGNFRINTSLADGGTYRFDMDDGDLELDITSGGGTFNIRHDDADISVGSSFRRTLDEENESEFELDGGSASFQIDVDDADIELRKSS